MQKKLRALPGTRRAGNQTSLIGSNFSSAFLFALSFFFAIKSSYPLGVVFYWVLFQSSYSPGPSHTMHPPWMILFRPMASTATWVQPTFHLDPASSLWASVLSCCLPAPDFHLDIPQASQTWGFSTSANMLLLNSHVSIHSPTFTQCPKIEICLLRLFTLP